MKYPLVHGANDPSANTTAAQQAAPTLSNDHFAMRLQQNWVSRNPHLDHLTQAAKDPLDDSLTSLNWLQNMNINLGEGTPPISPRNAPIDPSRVNPNQVLPTTLLHRSTSIDSAGRVGLDPAIQFEKVDYKTNPYIKPPYSYASLICMAMKQSRKSKMTLSAIYSWITDNFMYYKMAEPSWQNSIRHNLSLNKCFQKVARKKDEPGKGGFWRINPEYNALIDASSAKRKTKADLDASLKRLMEELDDGLPRKRSRSTDHDEANQAALSLSEYLNFDRLLNQDISVDGMKLKTEDIIDAQGNSHDMTLSPPTSDEGSTDSFEDLLNTGLQLDADEPGPSGMDMTVQGTKIEPPEWWTESFNGASFNGLLSGGIAIDGINHPWSTDKAEIDSAIADLSDMEKLLNTSFN